MAETDLHEMLRDSVFQTRTLELQRTSAAWFRDNHQLLPPGLAHDFFVWAWDEKQTQYQDFTEVSFLKQTLMYAAYNSIGVIGEREWKDYLSACSSGWVQYIFFEFLTDNLNLHYYNNLEDDAELGRRQETALRAFNDAFIRKLEGDPIPTAELLTEFRSAVGGLPLLERHLENGALLELIHRFLRERTDGATVADFEENLWIVFAANIDFCMKSLDLVRGHEGHRAAANRYARRCVAINTLLSPDVALSRDQALELRASEMMVSSNLLCFFSFAAMRLETEGPFGTTLRSGLTHRVVEGADILTRLANDLGALATADDAMVTAVFSSLRDHHSKAGNETATVAETFDCWQREAPQKLVRCARRLTRDMVLGEENIARYYGDGPAPASTLETIDYVHESVRYFARRRQETHDRFDRDCRELTAAMGSPLFAGLANRFVVSMQQLYQTDFDYFD